MNVTEKQRLVKEAEMQIKALKRIERWMKIAFFVSVIGVALLYAGIAGTEKRIFLDILGIILIVIGAICVVVLNLGLKNGRRNVEKIVSVLDKEAVS